MSVSRFAPIALFTYRRITHLERVLAALSACPEFAASRIFAFSDGPKGDAVSAEVAKVRDFLKAQQLPNMTIIEAPTNRGLAASIMAGVTQLCDEFGRVIVVEDDLILTPCTLTWFNSALEKYKYDSEVWQISAHQFSVPEFFTRKNGLFLHLTTSWGWATWKRAWDRYDPKAVGWERLKFDAALARDFDIGGTYPYARMLIDQMEGRVDSWAIRWWWSVFREGGMALFPPRSLLQNIGNEVTATHTRYRLLKRLIPHSSLNRNVSSADKSRTLLLERCPRLPSDIGVTFDDTRAVECALRASRRFHNRFRSAWFG